MIEINLKIKKYYSSPRAHQVIKYHNQTSSQKDCQSIDYENYPPGTFEYFHPYTQWEFLRKDEETRNFEYVPNFWNATLDLHSPNRFNNEYHPV